MKFGIISDLHMEFQPWLFEPKADVFYLNAGDTHPNQLTRDYFTEVMGPNYFYIYGNHDYYGGSFRDAEMDVFMKCVGGLKIAGATLWTDVTPVRWKKAYVINYEGLKAHKERITNGLRLFGKYYRGLWD